MRWCDSGWMSAKHETRSVVSDRNKSTTQRRWQGGLGPRSMCFLPGAFLLIRGSAFGATAHDEAHHAFMTLPPYTRCREGEARQLRSGPKPCRMGPDGRKCAPCYPNMLAHHEMALTCLQPVFVYVTTCHQQGQRRHTNYGP